MEYTCHDTTEPHTNLDVWRSRDLTLFGRVLIIQALVISPVVYSVSNVEFPQDDKDSVQFSGFYGEINDLKLKE